MEITPIAAMTGGGRRSVVAIPAMRDDDGALLSIFLRRRAFTLLELMCAVVIFATALITLSYAASRCVRGFSAAENVQTALNIVEGRLVEWQLQNSKREEVRAGTEEGEVVVRGRTFSWRNEVQSTDDPRILKYEFTIKWTEGGSSLQRVFTGMVPRSMKEGP